MSKYIEETSGTIVIIPETYLERYADTACTVLEDESLALNGFQMFLLYGARNPANILPKELDDIGRPYLWAAELICTLVKAGRLYQLTESDCCRWVAVENLNIGSLQRVELPFKDLVKGSGRWQAEDGGGHFLPLLEAVRRWMAFCPGQKGHWATAARYLQISSERLSRWARLERCRRRFNSTWKDSELISEVSGVKVYYNENEKRILITKDSSDKIDVLWDGAIKEPIPKEVQWQMETLKILVDLREKKSILRMDTYYDSFYFYLVEEKEEKNKI